MNRSIPFVLSLALIGPAALAEDQAQQPGAQDPAGAAAQQDAQDPTATAADDQAQPAAGRDEASQQKDPAKQFIKDQYSTNLYEIQVSQWVQQRAQDQQVKQFAQMVVKDHQQANQQLKQIAQSAGVQIQEKLDPVHQAKLQKFQQCAASEIDRKYAFSQAAGHMMGVLELTYQSRNAQNQDVKQYATKTLPKMKQHLDRATEIATSLAGGQAGGEAQPAAAREPADGATDQPADPSEPQQDPGATEQPQPDQDAAGTSGQSDPAGAQEQPQQ